MCKAFSISSCPISKRWHKVSKGSLHSRYEKSMSTSSSSSKAGKRNSPEEIMGTTDKLSCHLWLALDIDAHQPSYNNMDRLPRFLKSKNPVGRYSYHQLRGHKFIVTQCISRNSFWLPLGKQGEKLNRHHFEMDYFLFSQSQVFMFFQYKPKRHDHFSMHLWTELFPQVTSSSLSQSRRHTE